MTSGTFVVTCEAIRRSHGRLARRERGVALLATLLLLVVATALGAALIAGSRLETLIAWHVQAAGAARYSAESAIALAAASLRHEADWSAPLRGLALAPWRGSCSHVPGPSLDVERRTRQLQRREETDAGGAEPSVWALYGVAALADFLDAGGALQPYCVGVWIADDVHEQDSDPLADSNGRLRVWGEAWSARGRASVEALLERRQGGMIRVIAARQPQ
jgi:hypothetical protein